MRLFVAVNFQEELKEKCYELIGIMKELAVQGNFTRRDNLHLTLAFLGETSKVKEIKMAMEAVRAESFKLEIGGLGRFRRSGGDIYWLAIKPNNELNRLHGQLTQGLAAAGFALEEREYKPHLTLGRQVILPKNYDRKLLEQAESKHIVEVNKISLMKSERINGRLVYSEIFSHPLSSL